MLNVYDKVQDRGQKIVSFEEKFMEPSISN